MINLIILIIIIIFNLAQSITKNIVCFVLEPHLLSFIERKLIAIWIAHFHKLNSVQWRLNPLVPDVHYSERQDKPFSLQIQQLEVDFK